MNFLDFIFDNFFIVLIIAFGVINFLSRMAKGDQSKQKEQTSRTQNPKTETGEPVRRETPTREKQGGSMLGRMAEKMENTFEEFTGQFEQEQPQETIAEQQRKQYEQLKKDVQHEYAEYTDEESHRALKREKPKSVQPTVSQSQIGDVQLDKLTTRKGLVQGMIMSEVLGPPRALKPYSSIVKERRR